MIAQARPVRIENEEALFHLTDRGKTTVSLATAPVEQISNSPGIRVAQIERHAADIDHGEVPSEILCPD